MLDLEEIGERVKDMGIVSFSQGNFFYFKALLEKESETAMQMLMKVFFIFIFYFLLFFLISPPKTLRQMINTTKHYLRCLKIVNVWSTELFLY